MNPWKLTVIVMALVASTAIVTGLVVARWSGNETSLETNEAVTPPATPPRQVAATPQPTPRPAAVVKPKPAPVQQAAATAPPPPPPATPAPPTVSPPPNPPPAAAVPTQEAIDACNRYAAEQVGERSNTKETVTDALIGAVAGAAIGAAGGGIAGGGKRRRGRRRRRHALRPQREQEARRSVSQRVFVVHAQPRLPGLREAER